MTERYLFSVIYILVALLGAYLSEANNKDKDTNMSAKDRILTSWFISTMVGFAIFSIAELFKPSLIGKIILFRVGIFGLLGFLGSEFIIRILTKSAKKYAEDKGISGFDDDTDEDDEEAFINGR